MNGVIALSNLLRCPSGLRGDVVCVLGLTRGGILYPFVWLRGVTRVKALFRRLDQPTMHHGSSSTFGNLYSFRLAQRRKYRTKEGNPDDTIVQVLSSTLESECTLIVVKLNFVGSNPTRSKSPL